MSSNNAGLAASGWSVYRRLLAYLRPYLSMFLISLLGFAIYAATQAAFAKWMEEVVDAIEKNALEQRALIALAVVGIFFVRGLGAFLGNYGLAYVARQIVHKLRIDLFNQLLLLPSDFYHQQSSGQLLSKLTFNVEQVTGAATDAVKVVVREGLTVIGLMSYLLYLNWKLTLVFLIVGPVIGWVVSLASKRFRKLSHGIQNSMGDVTNSASEAIKGYQVVRIFGGTEFEQQRFAHASEYNRRQFMKMVVTQSVSTPAVQMLVAGALAALMYLAMHPSIMSSMSTGEFIAFITAAGMITKPLRQITEVNSIIQRGIAAAQSLFELIDEPVEPDKGSRQLARASGKIEFDNLNFSYAGSEEHILDGISATIAPGQVVALVGHSGSGKSTLASLLARFYEAPEGSLRIDDHNISEYRLADLRRQIALVNQQVVLFNGTIAENIAYGQLNECSEEEVIAAAERAYAMEFILKLPDGLQTVVGENGVLLSGGQRQRIAIARAILKDAPILILDEATSALDTESERYIQSALEHVMQNRTTLVIAHRLSTIENADQILVMSEGRIVERGSHTALLKQNGEYANLYRMQFSETSESRDSKAETSAIDRQE
ncbi:MAG: lipid A export permease/ATP-binding protein MsbA [Amphritea sp.]